MSNSVNRRGLVSEVKPILANSTDTLLSAERANEIIDLFNAFDKIVAEPPLYIFKSDSNMVFTYVEPDPILENEGLDDGTDSKN